MPSSPKRITKSSQLSSVSSNARTISVSSSKTQSVLTSTLQQKRCVWLLWCHFLENHQILTTTKYSPTTVSLSICVFLLPPPPWVLSSCYIKSHFLLQSLLSVLLFPTAILGQSFWRHLPFFHHLSREVTSSSCMFFVTGGGLKSVFLPRREWLLLLLS